MAARFAARDLRGLGDRRSGSRLPGWLGVVAPILAAAILFASGWVLARLVG